MLAPELTANYSISLAEMGYAPSAKLLAVRPLDTPAAPSGGWASRPGTVAVTEGVVSDSKPDTASTRRKQVFMVSLYPQAHLVPVANPVRLETE